MSKIKTKEGKQIRIWVTKQAYPKLKQEAKRNLMDLELYCGLILSGVQITPPTHN